MWVRINPNPKHKHVPDCVIRALAIVLNKTWFQVYDDLYIVGRWECSVSCHDDVWGAYLHMQGFEQFMLPESCPRCITIRDFTRYFPKGRYVIGTGSLPFLEEYGYDQDHNLSGRRGRDSMGRYASMDAGPAMSGHWSVQPPMWSGSYRGYPPNGNWR